MVVQIVNMQQWLCMSKKIAIYVCFVCFLLLFFLWYVLLSFLFTESDVGRKKIVSQKKGLLRIGKKKRGEKAHFSSCGVREPWTQRLTQTEMGRGKQTSSTGLFSMVLKPFNVFLRGDGGNLPRVLWHGVRVAFHCSSVQKRCYRHYCCITVALLCNAVKCLPCPLRQRF